MAEYHPSEFDAHEAERREVVGVTYNWLPDFVYGGIDGAVTTFAIVAGVEGANLSVGVVLVLGFANLFADGFSMATGKYLSDKAEKEQYEKIRKMEKRHLKKYPEIEKAEIEEMLEEYGFSGDNLKTATAVITRDPESWLNFMMKHEFSITGDANPLRGGMATLISFIVVGFIPLAAYTFQPLLELTEDQVFVVTAIATLLAMFGIGAVQSKFTVKPWWRSGIEVMLLGGLAASIAYGVGVMLKGLL